MADIYVKSGAANSSPFASWANAATTLAGAAGIDAAGDTIYVSQAHSESTAGSVTVALAGTAANPVRVICGNDAAEPPTSVASTGVVAATAGNLAITGSAYLYGLTLRASSIVALNDASSGANAQTYEDCTFDCTTNGSGSFLRTASANNGTYSTKLVNPTIKIAGANNTPVTIVGSAEIYGGQLDAASATPSNGLFAFAGDRTAGRLLVDGMDLSNLSSSGHLFRGGSAVVASGKAVLRNCRLPSGWTGSLCSTAVNSPGQRYEMWNCDSGDTNYRVWIEDYAGSVKHTTTIYKDSFSGGTAHSLLFASSANARYPLITLAGPDFFADNSTVGSSVTATVEIVTDNVTLTDAECYLEVMYMGTSGVPLGTWIRDSKANVLASAANQASSSESWTTTGLGTPVKQKLSVTFTPQEAGYVIGRVVLCKASTTVYVDPELVLS